MMPLYNILYYIMVLSKIPTDAIRSFVNPHTFPKDCCPCVFNLMGVPLQNASIIEQASRERGMYIDDILNFFRVSYPKFSFESMTHDFRGITRAQGENMVSIIYETIPPEHGVICGFVRRDGTAHCVLLYKGDGNEKVLIDVQAERWAVDDAEIFTYFDVNHIQYVQIVHGYHKKSRKVLYLQG